MDEIGKLITEINNKNHFDNLSKIVENAIMTDLLKNPIVINLVITIGELKEKIHLANLEIAELKKG